MAKCPKCGYDPDRNIEMEKAKALQQERDGNWSIEDVLKATKSILPGLWIDDPKQSLYNKEWKSESIITRRYFIVSKVKDTTLACLQLG